MEIVERFFTAPKRSFFLFGPRGTGKSTWAESAFPDAITIDLLQLEAFREYAARPERLRELLDANPKAKDIVIDEVQRVPSLLRVVHALTEQRRAVRFVLTGSTARKIKRADVDLLAGRALLRTLHPFMAAELGRSFRLEDALRLGMVPLVVRAEEADTVLRSYVALYIQEEVKAEALVRDVGNFTRFLEVASLSHAAVLNVSNLARECEIGRKTAEGYLAILDDLLLAHRVPVFTKRAKRAVASHPKFYLFDAGVFRSLRPKGPLDRPEEADGAALEGLVMQHLRAWNAYRGEKNGIHYWRTRSGVEVDIILYGEEGIWAIEVMNSRQIRPQDLRGLKSFLEDYPQARPLLLYRGKERLKRDGILCVPCDEFLGRLHPDRSLAAIERT